MATDPDHQLPAHLRPTPPRSKWPFVLAGAAVALVAVVALAIGVFEVHTLFIDDEVAEAAPTFSSGASLPATDDAAPPTTEAPASEDGAAPPTTVAAATVTVAGTGPFVERGHPGEGTATLLTDGTQTFLRFEDDFSTDNGPDLRVRAYAGDEVIDLGALKGNVGAQNYELPPGVDPAAVTKVDVWCRRFDYVFTDAELSAPA